MVMEMVEMMIETILKVLQENKIQTWLMEEIHTEKAELFFVKKELDMRRFENVQMVTVYVYCDFEKDGVRYLGNASFIAEPSATEQELQEKCKGAYAAASFVPNPFYEIASEVKQECVTMESDLAELSLEAAAGKVAEAIYAGDCEEKSFVNSAEVFVERIEKHILNSRGVDVSYVKYKINGEFVAQCKELQDVEMYSDFSYDCLQTEALTEQVRETLQLVRDRTAARVAPKTGTYDMVLAGKYAAAIFEYYAARSNGGYIYQGYSDYKPGEFVQGKREEVKGQLLNLTYVPTEPFSVEGVPMKELSCIRNGVFENIQAGARFVYYLGTEATGNYTKLACEPGVMPFDEMKKRKGLYVVNFSDFQMDPFNGCYGGEIRLAYLNDGKNIIPVTGGSVNGNIYDAQKDFVFSKETQDISTFTGPKAVLLKNVSVAGA